MRLSNQEKCDKLVAHVCLVYAESDNKKLEQPFADVELVGQKPSQMQCEVRHLGNRSAEDVLQLVWVCR